MIDPQKDVIGGSYKGTTGRVVGVGAIVSFGNALEFGDEVAGTAVDGLASERAGQTSIRRVDPVDGRIARGNS